MYDISVNMIYSVTNNLLHGSHVQCCHHAYCGLVGFRKQHGSNNATANYNICSDNSV